MTAPEADAVTVAKPGLNQAVDDLVQSLEATASLLGIRAGIGPMIQVAEAFASPDDPAEKEARELLRVWQAFDALVAAVHARRVDA